MTAPLGSPDGAARGLGLPLVGGLLTPGASGDGRGEARGVASRDAILASGRRQRPGPLKWGQINPMPTLGVLCGGRRNGRRRCRAGCDSGAPDLRGPQRRLSPSTPCMSYRIRWWGGAPPREGGPSSRASTALSRSLQGNRPHGAEAGFAAPRESGSSVRPRGRIGALHPEA